MFMKQFIIIAFTALVLCPCQAKKPQKEERKVAYLAAYMKGNDEKNMYYALCENKFIFSALNEGNPVISASFDDKLLRDPMVLQGKDGVYHLVATVSWKNRPFTIWDSKDLITWENERLVDIAPEGATKTWAPEFVYDEEKDLYLVYWTAEIHDDWSTASIYYATTKDFVNFSDTRILYKEDDGILDANIVKVNGLYHLIYRRNGIRIVTSAHAQGPYSNSQLLTPENVEGPFAFPLKEGNGYGIVWDYFGKSLGYGLWTSPDFKEWIPVTNKKYPYYNENVEFPAGIRHGSIVGLTQKELKKIKKAFK